MRSDLAGRLTRRDSLALLALVPFASPSARATALPDATTTSIAGLVDAAIARQGLPGAVVVIGQRDEIRLHLVAGSRALVPQVEAMTADTIFDMASLTKVTITAPCVMQLWEQQRFGLDDPVATLLPEFGTGPAKRAITWRHILTHHSGLPPDLDLRQPWQGRETAFAMALQAEPIAPPGDKFIYSDINFILAGLLVERLSGMREDAYAAKYLLAPIGLTQSGYLPPSDRLARIAPTQWRWDAGGALTMTRGVVHDPTAFRMGGVAGHAGLFATAADMTRYVDALMDRRAGRPSAFPLKRETLLLMSTPQQPAASSQLRGLGWDIDTHFSTPRGAVYPKTSFGHTGYTGTSIWMDPGSGSWVLILTNRVHPDGGGHGIIALRHDIATVAARAILNPG